MFLSTEGSQGLSGMFPGKKGREVMPAMETQGDSVVFLSLPALRIVVSPPGQEFWKTSTSLRLIDWNFMVKEGRGTNWKENDLWVLS